MKTKQLRKTTLAILLLLVMLAGMLSPSVFADTGQTFRDVSPGSWYERDVEYCCQRGIMNGTGKTKFSPNDHATRGQVITVLWRLADCPEPETDPPFDDVKKSDFFSAAVAWSAANGITKGVSANKYSPHTEISRAEVITLLYRQYGKTLASSVDENLLSAYQDSDQISAWAREAVAWAIQTGVMEGKTKTRFDPAAPVKRCELAAIFHRLGTRLETPAPKAGVLLKGKLLTLEESTAQLIEDFGKPNQKIESAYPFTWWVYGTGTYEDFFLAGVADDRIVALWIENKSWRSVSGYRAGSSYSKVSDPNVFAQPSGAKAVPYGYYACVHTPYEDYRLVTRTDQTHLDNEARIEVRLISAYRVFNGLPPVTRSQTASKAAQQHSDDMKQNGFASHIGSDGSTPRERMNTVGLADAYLGETIGAGVNGILLTHTNLVSSAPHRAILLLAGAVSVGVGVAYGRVKNATGLIVTEDYLNR